MRRGAAVEVGVRIVRNDSIGMEFASGVSVFARDVLVAGNGGAGIVFLDPKKAAMTIEHSAGEYRAGDQLWLRQSGPENFARLLNRDVLAPRPGGRFAFGRMIDRDGSRVALLPPGAGSKQVVVENPTWIAVAEMLVRPL